MLTHSLSELKHCIILQQEPADRGMCLLALFEIPPALIHSRKARAEALVVLDAHVHASLAL